MDLFKKLKKLLERIEAFLVKVQTKITKKTNFGLIQSLLIAQRCSIAKNSSKHSSNFITGLFCYFFFHFKNKLYIFYMTG